jgi:hypothetical protein
MPNNRRGIVPVPFQGDAENLPCPDHLQRCASFNSSDHHKVERPGASRRSPLGMVPLRRDPRITLTTFVRPSDSFEFVTTFVCPYDSSQRKLMRKGLKAVRGQTERVIMPASLFLMSSGTALLAAWRITWGLPPNT